MATEYVQVLDTNATDVTVVNTTALSTLYSYSLAGGLLSTANKLRWQGQGKISFLGATSLNVHSYYGGVTVSSCIVACGSNANQLNKAVFIEDLLGGDNSSTSQIGLIRSELGLNLGDDNSTPVGFGTCGVNSNGAQNFEIKCQWGQPALTNSFTLQYSSLELISYIADVITEDLDDPTAYIFINSKLNNLKYNIRKYAYFYAPLEYETDFYGYGSVSFTRATPSTAVWRDGTSHTVAANIPRFEYSGETVSGLAISTVSETLNYSTANTLHDSNTLIWMENNVFKNTPTNTNPFSAAGNFVGNNTHLTQVVKFNKILSGKEIEAVRIALT